MLLRLKEIARQARQQGIAWILRHGTRYAFDKIADLYFDWRWGIDTSHRVTRDQLGYTDLSLHKYTPTDYLGFQRVMRHVRVTGEDVFIDYGSGMGRVLIMAAMYPFKRVLGVELSPSLNEIAVRNVDRVRGRLRCQNIEAHQRDATTFPLPDNVTVVFCYSPFRGAVLSKVVDQIEDSLRRAPRKATIIFKNPAFFDLEVQKRPWIVKRAEFAHYSRHP